MAATLGLTVTLSLETPQPHRRRCLFSFPPNHNHLYLYSVSKRHRLTTFSHSHSSLTTAQCTTARSTTYPGLEDSFGIERSLSNEELEKLKILDGFNFSQELPTGSLRIRAMKHDDVDITVRLLADALAESVSLPTPDGYEAVLRFYLKWFWAKKKKAVLPHAVTLVGFYKSKEEEEEEPSGMVGVCFGEKGAYASYPTPTPPKNAPYICNVTVKKSLRRKGIGRTLLKASEKLIYQIGCSKEVYLHCQLIDSVPFNMYVKAGYKVLGTNSIWIQLLLQKRRHLMFKNLVDSENSPIPDTTDIDSVNSSQQDMQMS